MSKESVTSRLARRTRLLFPDPIIRAPSERDRRLARRQAAGRIVQQHAEGSVLLASGRYRVDGDLLAEDE